MKKICLLLVLACLPGLTARANNTTPVLICFNDGLTSVPTLAQLGANAVIGINVNGSAAYGIGVNITGALPGTQSVNWHDYGSGVLPVTGATIAYTSGAVVDSLTGPVPDVNGSPLFTCYYHWPGGEAPVITTTNVTIWLTNRTVGTAQNMVWKFNGNIVQEIDGVCYSNAYSDSATLTYTNGFTTDTFVGQLGNSVSTLSNIVITLQNPSNSGQIENFFWYANGVLVKEIDHVCPGVSQAVLVTYDSCNGGYSTTVNNVGPSSTNMVMTVTNPDPLNPASAWWTLNGRLLKGETLLPGASDTVNQTIDLCGINGGNVNLQWGCSALANLTGNNPFDGITNMFGQWGGSPTNAWNGTTRSGGGTPGSGSSSGSGAGTGTGDGSTGGVGGTGGSSGTGGGSPPNTPIITNTVGGQTWTNNINWPTPPAGGSGGSSGTNGSGNTSGLALDSTLRAGFGQLHYDNGQSLLGLGKIDTDIQAGTAAELATAAALTNANGTARSNVWVGNQLSLTNTEALLGSATNLLTSIYTNLLGQDTTWAFLTNAAGQQVAMEYVLSNDLMQVVRAITNNGVSGTNDLRPYLSAIQTNGTAALSNDLALHVDVTNALAALLVQQLAGNSALTNVVNAVTAAGSNSAVATAAITNALAAVGSSTRSNVWVMNQISTTNLETLVAASTNDLYGIYTNVLGLNSHTTYLTNAAGQLVQWQYALSNDVMQLVRAVTNAAGYNGDTNASYGLGIYTNALAINQNNQVYHGEFTNEIGQIISYEAVMSNELLVITKELTNLPAPVVNVTNHNNVNVTVTNAPTFAFTNTWPGWTNYALEATQSNLLNTLAGISNLLSATNRVTAPDTNFAGLDTNSPIAGWSVGYDGPTNYAALKTQSDADSSASGLSTVEDMITSLRDSISDFSDSVADNYPAVEMKIDFGAYGAGVMDCDPLHTGWGAELFLMVKRLITWLLAFWFLMKVLEDAWKAVFVITGAHGINPAAVRAKLKETGTTGLPGNPNV